MLQSKVRLCSRYNLSLKIEGTRLRAADIERISSDTDRYNVLRRAYSRFKILLELCENVEDSTTMISTDLSILDEYIQNLSQSLGNNKRLIFPSEAFNRLAIRFNELVKIIA